MAKSSNLPAKRFKAGERSCTKLRFFLDADGGSPDRNKVAYIDIAQCLSVINQRAYRQGLYYYVAGVTVHNTADARVIFSTAPDTWNTKNAWVRGWKAWMRMQREAMRETGFIQSQYADYKVLLDDDHVALVTATSIDRGTDDDQSNVVADNIMYQPSNNLLPVAYDKGATFDSASSMPTPLVCDEWALSVYVAPDHGSASGNTVDQPDSFVAHIVGGHEGDGTPYESVGLIQSYTDTRPFTGGHTEGEPHLEAGLELETDPILSVFDKGGEHEEVLKDIDNFNDVAPYEVGRPFGYDDDQLYQVLQLKTQAAGGGSIIRGAGFCVPFGLLRIDIDDTSGIEIVLDMLAGPYHGVYAERVI